MAAPTVVTLRPGVTFTPDAGASFRRAEAEWGRPIDVNSTYRNWNTQWGWYTAWNAYVAGRGPHPGHSRAIHPDLSVHCQGRALDSDDWRTPGFIALMARHGWIRTAAGDPTEQHHFEYQWWRDQYRGAFAGGDWELIATPTQRGAIDMPMLYTANMPSAPVPAKFLSYNAGLVPSKPTYFLLGGSPGTPLNAAITQDQTVASNWAQQLAPTLDNPSEVIIPASWAWADQLWDHATAPLRIDFTGLSVQGSGGGGASAADVNAAADRVIAAVPTAEQNGQAAREAIVKP